MTKPAANAILIACLNNENPTFTIRYELINVSQRWTQCAVSQLIDGQLNLT